MQPHKDFCKYYLDTDKQVGRTVLQHSRYGAVSLLTMLQQAESICQVVVNAYTGGRDVFSDDPQRMLRVPLTSDLSAIAGQSTQVMMYFAERFSGYPSLDVTLDFSADALTVEGDVKYGVVAVANEEFLMPRKEYVIGDLFGHILAEHM